VLCNIGRKICEEKSAASTNFEEKAASRSAFKNGTTCLHFLSEVCATEERVTAKLRRKENRAGRELKMQGSCVKYTSSSVRCCPSWRALLMPTLVLRMMMKVSVGMCGLGSISRFSVLVESYF